MRSNDQENQMERIQVTISPSYVNVTPEGGSAELPASPTHPPPQTILYYSPFYGSAGFQQQPSIIYSPAAADPTIMPASAKANPEWNKTHFEGRHLVNSSRIRSSRVWDERNIPNPRIINPSRVKQGSSSDNSGKNSKNDEVIMEYSSMFTNESEGPGHLEIIDVYDQIDDFPAKGDGDVHPGLEQFEDVDMFVIFPLKGSQGQGLFDQRVFQPYGIYDKKGQLLLICGQSSRSSFWGQSQPFKLILFNTSGRSLISVERSCSPLLCCCGSQIIGSGVRVSSILTNQTFGRIEQRCSCPTAQYDIVDGSDGKMVSIQGQPFGTLISCLGPWAKGFSNKTFNVWSEGRLKVGVISKDLFCDIPDLKADTCWVGAMFLGSLDSTLKLLLLGALLSIEISYYETQGSRDSSQFLKIRRIDHCCVHSCICFILYAVACIGVITLIVYLVSEYWL